MSDNFRTSQVYRKLRKKANGLFKRHNIELSPIDQKDLMQVAHELEVQQIELELQNEELNAALKDIEHSRNKYFELYQSAPVAFLTIDKKGLIIQVNEGAAKMLAGPADFIIGRAFSSLVVADDQALYFACLKDLALRKGGGVCELRLLSQQNQVFHAALVAAPQHDRHGEFFEWRYGLIDITSRKQVEEKLGAAHDKLNLRNQQLARLTTELTLAEQRERRRLAGILHDDLQQMLAGARLNLDIFRDSTSEKNAAIEAAFNLITQSLKTSRTLSMELAPPTLYIHGLGEALKWLARWMEETHKLKIDVNVDPSADPVQEELKLLLFQSVRELLFNVVKHAGTHSARVNMKLSKGLIIITVNDKGSGFDPQALFQSNPGAGSSYGLFNIRERLLLLGGDFEIASRPDDGTIVTLTAPIRTAVFDMPAPVQRTPADQHLPTGESEPIAKKDSKIRLLLVDDHSVVRKGLSSLLSRHDDIHVAGEAADGEQAVELARRINPNVILMDISMPVMDGIEATRIIHEQLPHINVIALSMYDDNEQAEAMKNAGAIGFISKSSSPDVILTVIRQNGDGS